MTEQHQGEPCAHSRHLHYRDENDNRIRTLESCRICVRAWYGCYAKRLDDEGQTAWGPPGQWWFSEKTGVVGFTSTGEAVFGDPP